MQEQIKNILTKIEDLKKKLDEVRNNTSLSIRKKEEKINYYKKEIDNYIRKQESKIEDFKNDSLRKTNEIVDSKKEALERKAKKLLDRLKL